MTGMSRASLILSALLACFGLLVSAQGTCTDTGTNLIPNPTDCSSFFTCVPVLQRCPPGLLFNKELKACDLPQYVNCEPGCLPLKQDANGAWVPSACTVGPIDIGGSCKLRCKDGYQLRGSSSIQCTDKGWNSVNGNVIPKCVPEECIGLDLENDLDEILSSDAGILFVLDESGSVTYPNFEKNKVFVKDVIQKYPLSENRSAGVITFSSSAVVKIHLNVDSTSAFLQAVDNIQYGGGSTNLLAGLQLAVDEIKHYSLHDLTLVILITDGMSQTDGTPAADEIKKAGNPLFAIGIDKNNDLVHLESLASTKANGIKHFFHITSYDVLENIGKYLNPPPGSGGNAALIEKCKNY